MNKTEKIENLQNLHTAMWELINSPDTPYSVKVNAGKELRAIINELTELNTTPTTGSALAKLQAIKIPTQNKTTKEKTKP